jgi:hypothetical protein
MEYRIKSTLLRRARETGIQQSLSVSVSRRLDRR